MTWPSVAERRAASDRLYERDPQRFAGEPSHFVVWALKRLPHHDRPLRILELGCGVGRDSRILASEGHQVRAVDHSRVAIGRARSGPHGPPGLEFLEEEALVAVARTPAGTVDVVYAHGLYMGFSEGELDELVAGVRRILSSGGQSGGPRRKPVVCSHRRRRYQGQCPERRRGSPTAHVLPGP